MIADKPLINLSGCPPLPLAISGTLAHYLLFDEFPALDDLGRPRVIYGNTIHERCSRLHFFEQKKFARSFDDEGARKGWCLYELGCKGPLTHNACATTKWNGGTSFPIESGHPCLGCSEPGFWDRGGFYETLIMKQTAADAVASGRSTFESSCVYCHRSGAEPFRTEPDRIPDLFGAGASPAHRFAFSKDELNNLVEYIKSLAGKGPR
jgi:hydrogenase small subunit